MFAKKTALRCVGILMQISDKKMRKNVHPDNWWHFILRNESTLEVCPATPIDVRRYFRQGYDIINLYIPSNDFDNGDIYCRDCAIEKLPHFHIPINSNTLIPVPDDNAYLIVDRDKINKTFTIVDKDFTNKTIHASKLIKLMQTGGITVCNATLTNGTVHIRCVDSLITKGEPVLVKPPKLFEATIPDAKSRYLTELHMAITQWNGSQMDELKAIYNLYIPTKYCTKGSTVASRLKAAGIDTINNPEKFSKLLSSVCDFFRSYFKTNWEIAPSKFVDYPLSVSSIETLGTNGRANGQDFLIYLNIDMSRTASKGDLFIIWITVNPDYIPLVKDISGSPLLRQRLLPSYLNYSAFEEEPIEYLIKKTPQLPAWVKHLYDNIFSVGHKIEATNGKYLSKLSLYELTARLHADYSFSCTNLAPHIVKVIREITPVAELANKQRNVLDKFCTKSGISYEELSSSIYMLGALNSPYFVVATSFCLDDHAVGLVLTLVAARADKGIARVLDAYGFIQTDEDEYTCEHQNMLHLKNGEVHSDVDTCFAQLARFYAEYYK